ncbi:hypothetical protein RDWZM_001076 [Blomia tropicalis]|uniref:COMM domain-containing protein 5 n=1 Tax=Blomia tropicalis TaxID=40697 RepID=A0A9Q0RQA0_BLOTA|nr:hypothetical protein RDWZM_001076 [Blomia tropicalis]
MSTSSDTFNLHHDKNETGTFFLNELNPVSSQVQFASKLFSASDDIIEEGELYELIQMVLNYVCERKFSRSRYLRIKNVILEQWKQSQMMIQLNLSTSDFDRLFSGLLTIIQNIKRYYNFYENENLIPKAKNDFISYTKMSSKVIDIIFQLFIQNRKIDNSPKLKIGKRQRLDRIEWRIDVVISDRSLNKIMEPIVRFNIVFINNENQRKCHKFECRLEQFHRLRFMVTCALKELTELNFRLKIVN